MALRALLQKLGCDEIETTRERFLDDGAFYLEITTEMLQDPAFLRLGEQLTEHETHAAFDTAHMLKGIIGNCGITPLYKLIVQIVEPLRSGSPDFGSLKELYEQLLRVRDVMRKKLTE